MRDPLIEIGKAMGAGDGLFVDWAYHPSACPSCEDGNSKGEFMVGYWIIVEPDGRLNHAGLQTKVNLTVNSCAEHAPNFGAALKDQASESLRWAAGKMESGDASIQRDDP